MNQYQVIKKYHQLEGAFFGKIKLLKQLLNKIKN